MKKYRGIPQKRRNSIYKKALRLMEEVEGLGKHVGLCNILQRVSKLHEENEDLVEFMAFKPADKAMHQIWFSGRAERMEVLRSCIADSGEPKGLLNKIKYHLHLLY